MKFIYFIFALFFLVFFSACNANTDQEKECIMIHYFSKQYLVPRNAVYDFAEKHDGVEIIYDLKFKKSDKERTNLIVVKVPFDKLEIINTQLTLDEATFKQKTYRTLNQLNEDYNLEEQHINFNEYRLVVFEVNYHKY